MSLEPLKGTCEALESMDLIHSFNARRLLLISAPSTRRYFELLEQSYARSLPAKSTMINFPRTVPLLSFTTIYFKHMTY